LASRTLLLLTNNFIMKKLNSIAALCLLLMACGQKQLTNSEATKIITSQIHYPKVYTYPINTQDEDVYHRLHNSSLVKGGYLLTPGFTLEDRLLHKPLIALTQSGKTFQVSDPDTSVLVMKVADEHFKELESVTIGSDGKTATASYKTIFKNPTPFAVIVPEGLPKEADHTVNFHLQDDGWHLDQN
jgi:hypothetical protein